MGRTVRTGCAFALACGLLLGACGGDDDEPTAGDDPTEGTVKPTTTTVPGTEPPSPDGGMVAATEETTTTATATTDAPAEGAVATIDGETGTIEGSLTEGGMATHQIHVPAGVTATVTVTPTDDIDIVVEGSQESVDDGLSGDPEVLEGNGPIDETIEVSEFYDETGGYRITITSRPS